MNSVHTQSYWRTIRASCLLLWLLSSTTQADEVLETDFFEKQVRPILVERCEGCHSSAKGKTSGGLALDTRDGWMKGGDSGSPVLPGKPNESLFIRAIRYDAEGPQMPPKDKGGRLTDREIQVLTDWVMRGASDPRVAVARVSGMSVDEVRNWWSFQKIGDVSPPKVTHESQVRSAVDQFVLAALERQGQALAAHADRRTLIRRATYDLTGLPPTIEEIEAFLSDTSDEAFSRVVDRLLDSPAYGERWARHWLDVVRYADFHDANPKARTASCEITEAWRYRDWVVDSLNRDLPYDQFIQHQIAGDLLPSPTGDEVYPAGLIATTFLTNGVWDRGDADKEKIVSDMVDDNIDTIGKAFLGLTLGCARCHDHKFDPVSAEDYYALAGVFYSSHILKDLGIKGGEYTMNRVPLVPKAVLERRREQEQQLTETQTRLDKLDQLARFQNLTTGGTVLLPIEFTSAAGSTGIISADGVVAVKGTDAKDTYTLQVTSPKSGSVRWIRLEVFADPQLPGSGPGRAGDGNFVINRFQLLLGQSASPQSLNPVKWVSAKSDYEQKGFVVAGTIDERSESGWSVGPEMGQSHVAVFELPPEISVPHESPMTFVIDQTHSERMTLGKFRLSALEAIAPPTPLDVPERSALETTREQLKFALADPIPVAMAIQEGGMTGGLFPGIQDVPIHLRGQL